MQTKSTIAALRSALSDARRKGLSIGLVPTMGYLHEGHMALAARARSENDIVVATIFVNPLQFGQNEDFSKYPRNIERDSAMLADIGVDYLFAPPVEEMYPQPMLTSVDVPALGMQLEGEVRPGHFSGVATVVTKLFNISGADRAYFGEKDYQQLVIIRRMVEDLNQPIEVIGVQTIREADGLACSSRNVYLSAEQRAAAVIVPEALAEAERLVKAGERDPQRLERMVRSFIGRQPLAAPEVVAIRDPKTLEAPETIGDQPVLLLLFVRFGATKLLDNRLLNAPTGQRRPQP